VYDAILDLPGFGNFLAYQVLVDCTYPLSTDDEASATADDVSTGRESLLPFSPNAWAVAGPGAKRGLALLSGDAGERDDLAVMRWLWRNQAREFERLGLAFDWLRDEAGERVALSLADVQNCCCEFHKYEKVKRGTGRARRRFRAGERRSADELRGCYSGYPISMRVEHYEGGPD